MNSVRISCVVLVCLVAVGGAVAFSNAAQRTLIPGGQVVSWTQTRVMEWQPKAGEHRFDEIGWAKDIRTARRLAQQSERPVFVFTMDGRINLGRC